MKVSNVIEFIEITKKSSEKQLEEYLKDNSEAMIQYLKGGIDALEFILEKIKK